VSLQIHILIKILFKPVGKVRKLVVTSFSVILKVKIRVKSLKEDNNLWVSSWNSLF